MEAKKYKDLQGESVSWTVDGVAPVQGQGLGPGESMVSVPAKGQQALTQEEQMFQFEYEGRKELMFQFKTCQSAFFLLFTPSTVWMRPTHTMEGHRPYQSLLM